MGTERLIERCITMLKADVRSLQRALDSKYRLTHHTRSEEISPHIAEALLWGKRTMLSNLRRERHRFQRLDPIEALRHE